MRFNAFKMNVAKAIKVFNRIRIKFGNMLVNRF